MEESRKNWQLVQTDEINNEKYNTYIIPRNEIKNKKILATGWKMLKYNYTTTYGLYKYEESKIYSVDRDIELCKNGLHFCENPIDCLLYGYSLESNFLIAKVNAYDKIKEDVDGRKTVAQTLEIVKIYNWIDFYEIAIKHDKKYSKNNKGSYESKICKEIKGGYDSTFCIDCHGISQSKSIVDSNGVDNSHNVLYGGGISGGIELSDCFGVRYSTDVLASCGIEGSIGIFASKGIENSNAIFYSSGINNSDGVICSNGVNYSSMIFDCDGLSNSIFCDNTSGKYKIFNKQVSKERTEAEDFKRLLLNIRCDILRINFKIENSKQGEKILCSGFKLSKDTIKKIKELPEYDEKIYNKIMKKMRTSFPKYKITKEEK